MSTFRIVLLRVVNSIKRKKRGWQNAGILFRYDQSQLYDLIDVIGEMSADDLAVSTI